jgi:linoleoyl-CoA desaturase
VGLAVGFGAELNARVDEALRARSARDPEASVLAVGYRRLHRKAMWITAWYVASYVLVVVASGWPMGVVACVSLALAMTAVGFNIQHDANHNAFFTTTSKRLTRANRMMGWSLYALGASSERWIDGHVKAHHSSTNIAGRDFDIELRPFARLAPSQPHHRWHRAQHFYAWGLYAFTGVAIIVADVISTTTEAFTGDRLGRRPTLRTWASLLGTKAVFIGLMLVIPLLLHPWWIVLLGAAGTLALVGILLGVVFQAAHVVVEAEFAEGSAPPGTRWHEWQVRSTVNFAHGDGPMSRVVTWYIGGLNYQIEHHLFPRLPHTVYREISPVVEATCRDHDVPYHVQPDVRTALASHYTHLRALGRGDTVS